MKLSIAPAGTLAFSQAAYAQPAQHPPGHAMANPATAATNADEAAVKDWRRAHARHRSHELVR